jgi:hypothetical protein
MIKFIAFTDNPPPTIESGTFQEVLREWGHTWMWEGLKLSGKDGDDTGTWLSTAIRNNTLVAVTDGLYMKEFYPNINSCAFIFECSAGGVIGHGIVGKDIPIMARLAEARRWSKR